jgi:predicted 2-oxoglutarate/Fe(II)-dependent dioxygenase YbiX
MGNNEIKVIENFLSRDECLSILNICKETINLSNAKVIGGNPKERKSSVGWINDLGYVNERLKNVLRDSYFFNGMEVTGLGPFQFTEYKVGEFYGWHTDRDSTTFSDRFTSTVIQLNDDYDGGILEIKNTKNELVSIENRIGTLYVFDSNLRHRVTPVESGVRYSLVNWISIIKTDSSQQNLI